MSWIPLTLHYFDLYPNMCKIVPNLLQSSKHNCTELYFQIRFHWLTLRLNVQLVDMRLLGIELNFCWYYLSALLSWLVRFEYHQSGSNLHPTQSVDINGHEFTWNLLTNLILRHTHPFSTPFGRLFNGGHGSGFWASIDEAAKQDAYK